METIWDIDPYTSSKEQEPQTPEATTEQSTVTSLGSRVCDVALNKDARVNQALMDPDAIRAFIDKIRETHKDDYDPFWK